MKRILFNRNTFALTISILIAGLFLYTGIIKFYKHSEFIRQLSSSPFTKAFPKTLAVVIPSAEIIVATLLIYWRSRLIGFYSSFLLTALFTTYIAGLLSYGYYSTCSCGGIISKLSWQQHLVFNAALLLLAGIGVGLMPTTKHNNIS